MKYEREKHAKEKKELDARIKEMKIASNVSNAALTKPSLRDLPIVLISPYKANSILSPQTVTFDFFLANYNKSERSRGGDGVLDLNTGIFTCITPGYYSVSFSLYDHAGAYYDRQDVFLYKNGIQLSESCCFSWMARSQRCCHQCMTSDLLALAF